MGDCGRLGCQECQHTREGVGRAVGAPPSCAHSPSILTCARCNGASTTLPEAITHPPHYCYGAYECLDVILDLQLPFLAAQCFKYLWRYRHKGKPLEDLRKARFYLDRLIGEHEREK
jgi:Protein of unknwon function (DUF3310)